MPLNATEVSDVSVVLLSLGEDTTQAAVESLPGQTMRPREIIVIEGVRPFYKALNTGASQVKTPFFVQVDADMVLDPRCIAELRNGVGRDTGVVFARLRDALTAQVVGVKLFRASCFEHAQFRDVVSPDTNFVDEIERLGWTTSEIGRLDSELDAGRHSVNTDQITRLFMRTRSTSLEGIRYRYRQTVTGLLWRFTRLQLSVHPAAWIAQVGLAQGLFTEANSDLLGASAADLGFARLESFLHRKRSGDQFQLRLPAAGLLPGSGSVPAMRWGMHWQLRSFRVCHGTGHACCHAGGVAELIDKVALCRGLLAGEIDVEAIDADYGVLSRFSRPATRDAARTARSQTWIRSRNTLRRLGSTVSF